MGEENAYLYRTSLYLAASASAEFFADIALAPMEAVKDSSKIFRLLPNFWNISNNPLTTGKGPFGPTYFLTLWEIEIAVIFRKYEK